MAKRVTLKQLLAEHRRYAARTPLATSLGDGYLYTHNTQFRNIRDWVRELGFQFTRDDYCHYRALPLAALPIILREQRMVYIDNATPLGRVERRSPGMFLAEMGIRAISNAVLHESMHCIADRVLPRAKTTRELVLRVLLAESVATTVDAFGVAYVRDDVHRIFHNYNSFYSLEPAAPFRTVLGRALRAHGALRCFKVLLFSHLYSSFLFKSVKRPELRRISALTGAHDERHMFPLLASHVDRVNRTFRIRVAEFYFHHVHRIRKSIFSLVDFDFVQAIMDDTKTISAIDQIALRLTTESPIAGP
jgi:hypothetical protein